ncbi:hypothetical protein M9H77_08895 [Catharanthus roseus]|uniref:Uncharacterized protein n=1 Tax=Catharanthus roseus TaxID=4058 RepID=A0ACC0BZ59_CATRO|nr:hypothetical protein M9H77_08895 [Catharanthus roseus]
MIGDDTNYDTQPESDCEDSQANNVAFHSQLESSNKSPTWDNSVVLTNSEDVELDKDDYNKLEEVYNLLYTTWKNLDQEYTVVKAKNVKLLEENLHINALYEAWKLELQQTTTQFEKTVEKLEKADKYMERLNKGKINLDKILETGKSCGDLTGLGYVDATTNKPTKQKNIKVILAGVVKVKIKMLKRRVVKPTRSCITDFVETTFVDTTPINMTPIVDVPAESTPSPMAQAPKEKLPTTPQVPESAVDNTQLGNTNLPFYTSLMSLDLTSSVALTCEPLDVNLISVGLDFANIGGDPSVLDKTYI